MSTINTYQNIFQNSSLIAKFDELDNTVYVAEVALTAANIIAMYTTPVTLVAGVAGKVLEVVSAVIIFDYGTVQMTGGGTVKLVEETVGTVLTGTIAASVINAAADSINRLLPLAVATTEAKGIQISNSTAVFATGDGVARVKVTYRTHTTGL